MVRFFKSFLKILFSSKGRISQSVYFLNLFLLLIIIPPTFLLVRNLAFLSAAVLGGGSEKDLINSSIVLFCLEILTIIYYIFCLISKRLHDINRSVLSGVLVFIISAFLQLINAFSLLDFFLHFYYFSILLQRSSFFGYAVYFMGLSFFIIFALILGFIPGTKGPNKYGPEPLQSE